MAPVVVVQAALAVLAQIVRLQQVQVAVVSAPIVRLVPVAASAAIARRRRLLAASAPIVRLAAARANSVPQF